MINIIIVNKIKFNGKLYVWSTAKKNTSKTEHQTFSYNEMLSFFQLNIRYTANLNIKRKHKLSACVYSCGLIIFNWPLSQKAINTNYYHLQKIIPTRSASAV